MCPQEDNHEVEEKKFYRMTIQPTMLYWSECLTLKKNGQKYEYS